MTQPARAATEQLLLSTAADHVIDKLDLSVLRDRKVWVEERYFKGYDAEYAVGSIRQKISEAGARLMSAASSADIIVEIRSAGLSEDSHDTLVGLPALQVPLPLAGGLSTPELALYKSEKADSLAKFALFAYERESGQHFHSSAAFSGNGHYYRYHILGIISWRRTDVPELSGKKK